jgi:hypothetical protein
MGFVVIGVDIGQKRDPTAICVAELDERRRHPEGDPKPLGDRLMLDPCRHEDDHWMIRHLERLRWVRRTPA